LYSQTGVIGFRAGNNTSLPLQASCTHTDGEIYKASVESDSLYFIKNNLKKVIVAVKNKSSFNSIPAIAIDKSGTYKDRIYICWSDEKNGLNNKDIFIVFSDDGGKTWTEPVLATYRPNHKDQFMPALAVDEKGLVYIIYYDAQNYFRPGYVDIYLAISNNGALKFNYYKLNEAPVKQTIRLQTESTLSVIKDNKQMGCIFRLTKNSLPVYTSINDSVLKEFQNKSAAQLTFEKTITFSEKMSFIFSSLVGTKVTAVITKPLLAGFEKIVVKDLVVKKGNNQLLIDTKKLGLQKGNYILTLYYNGKNDFAWITEE
jgi:hypothetical protein